MLAEHRQYSPCLGHGFERRNTHAVLYPLGQPLNGPPTPKLAGEPPPLSTSTAPQTACWTPQLAGVIEDRARECEIGLGSKGEQGKRLQSRESRPPPIAGGVGTRESLRSDAPLRTLILPSSPMMRLQGFSTPDDAWPVHFVSHPLGGEKVSDYCFSPCVMINVHVVCGWGCVISSEALGAASS